MAQSSRSTTEERSNVLCDCNRPAKISQAWTVKNHGRRFYTCRGRKEGGSMEINQPIAQVAEPKQSCEECEVLKRSVLILTERSRIYRNVLITSSIGLAFGLVFYRFVDV